MHVQHTLFRVREIGKLDRLVKTLLLTFQDENSHANRKASHLIIIVVFTHNSNFHHAHQQ